MENYLIIGGATGIGKEVAQQLSAHGQVYATYCHSTPPSTIPSVSYHYCNVLDEIVDFNFLPDTLNGLVYCVGSINLKPFARIKPENFVQDFQLQVVGAIKTIQAVLPKLKTTPQPSIVLFSTVAAQIRLNFHTQVATSKGAIEGITKALAAELAPQIRVNCIAPSLTDTPLAASLLNTPEKREMNAQRHPLKKIGSAQDIANMASFLFIVGQSHLDNRTNFTRRWRHLYTQIVLP